MNSILEQLLDLITALTLLILASYGTSYFWKRILTGKRYAIIAFPGVIIHELSHLFACLITLAKVEEVKLFSLSGGFVKHKKSKLPIIGEPIISLFPVIGGTISLFIIFFLFGINLPDLRFNLNFILESRDLFLSEWRNLSFWILIYLSTSIIISIIPSKKDLKNSLSGLLIILIIIFLAVELQLINKLPMIDFVTNMIAFSFLIGFFTLVFGSLIHLIEFLVSKFLAIPN